MSQYLFRDYINLYNSLQYKCNKKLYLSDTPILLVKRKEVIPNYTVSHNVDFYLPDIEEKFYKTEKEFINYWCVHSWEHPDNKFFISLVDSLSTFLNSFDKDLTLHSFRFDNKRLVVRFGIIDD